MNAKHHATQAPHRSPVRRFQTIIAAAAIFAIPIESSIACGDWGWYRVWFEPVYEDVTNELQIREGWALQMKDPEPASSSTAEEGAVASTRPKYGVSRGRSAKFTATRYTSLSRFSSRRGSASFSKRSKASPRYALVKTLTISGPWGAEVIIERSLDGINWSYADTVSMDLGSVYWKEPLCNVNCKNYKYRCTGTLEVDGFGWGGEE